MATRLTLPREQVFSDAGVPLPGAKLYTYSAGTSTPKATYTDSALTTPAANPVVADAGGRFGDVFLEDGSYKMVLQTSAGVQVWAADPVAGASSASSGSISSAENLLHNGGFAIHQRATTTGINDAYCLDRWYVLTNTGSLTIAQQNVTEAGQAYNIRMTQPDVTAKRFGLAQIVEARDAQGLRGAAVALAARVRFSVSAPVRYAILTWTGTPDGVTSDVVNDWTSASYTGGGFFKSTDQQVVATGHITPAANVWTDLPAITGTLSTATNNIIVMFWTENTAAQNVTLDLGLARLVTGDTADTFPARAYGNELTLCQRFYEICNVEPLQRTSSSSNWGGATFRCAFRNTKRTTPTIVLWDGFDKSGSSGNLTITGTASGSFTTVPRTDGVLVYGGLLTVGDYASGSLEAGADL
jgi:hypothetical protein